MWSLPQSPVESPRPPQEMIEKQAECRLNYLWTSARSRRSPVLLARKAVPERV